MDESMSEYISSTDELLVDDPDDLEWPETAAAYDVTIDEERDEIVIDSRKDNFTGRILNAEFGEVLSEDQYEDIMEAVMEMRSIQNDVGPRWEVQAETFPAFAPSLPVQLEYLYDTERPCVGARVSTEVDGDTYGFESVTDHDEWDCEPIDPLYHQFERQLRQLGECLWEDFVVDNVTLDED